MTTQNERDECAVLQRRPHSGDVIAASISSSDKSKVRIASTGPRDDPRIRVRGRR